MSKIIIVLILLLTSIPAQASTNSLKNESIKLNTQVVNASGTMSQNAFKMDKSPINQGFELCSDGNAYIAGHSSPTKRKQPAGRVFANLHKLKRGDIIESINCKYEVRSITIIDGTINEDKLSYRFSNEEVKFVKKNTFENGTLTLQTCTRKLGQLLIIKAVKL